MSHCLRCGANNEPASRFCVACGAPLTVLPKAAPPPAAAQVTASPAPSGEPPPPVAVAYVQSARPGPQRDNAGQTEPPSASLPYAETASPPTREEFEQQRAAAQAAAARMRSQSVPPRSAPRSAPRESPRGYYPSDVPASPYASPIQPATGAMPGAAQDPEAVPEGSPRILAGFIVSYDTHPLGRFWPIFQGRNRVGRHGSGADLDVELDHPTASSRHALVLASANPGRLKIEDTNSTNGTLVNGTRLAPGVLQELRDGDHIRFGLLSTIVKIV